MVNIWINPIIRIPINQNIYNINSLSLLRAAIITNKNRFKRLIISEKEGLTSSYISIPLVFILLFILNNHRMLTKRTLYILYRFKIPL